ncbi:cytochrome b [Salinarimonas soli]|uniref:Cytochrome b n=1 Tax=Salinarimonas soli TaxID=1638099 RepID=A0A5B2VWC5_9HYPH|nr:cytochrome b [Salinarimonas soli]KAA2242359.1 cytochrome b [Salinarimonas soli]
MARPRPAHYSGAQKALHWTIAALVLAMVGIGLTMTAIGEGAARNALYEIHKSIGVIVLSLTVVRLALRWRRGAPPLVAGLPGWQRAAAHASHLALYALLVAVPLVGWSGVSACCPPVNLFWTVPVTLPVGGGIEAAKPILAVHDVLALSLAAVVAIHIAAALHHHLGRRDETLRRMLPGSAAGQRQEVDVPHRAGRA